MRQIITAQREAEHKAPTKYYPIHCGLVYKNYVANIPPHTRCMWTKIGPFTQSTIVTKIVDKPCL